MPNIVAICAMYHLDEMNKMLKIATSQAEDLGYDIVDVIEVPGCMEIPLALDRMLSSDDVDGAFCLGIIEKGETDHGLVMGQGVVKTIIELQLVHNKPIGLGIIGVGTGVILGTVGASNIGLIVNALEIIFGLDVLPKGIYLIDTIPSELLLEDVLAVTLIAFLMTVGAALYPCYKAMNMEPAEALRYD